MSNAGDAVSVVASLARAIIAVSEDSPSEEQIEAMEIAAETMKARLDSLKFPKESND